MLTMEEALKQSPARFATGQNVKGTVIEVRPKEVLVDIGYKSEGLFPATNSTTSKRSNSAMKSMS